MNKTLRQGAFLSVSLAALIAGSGVARAEDAAPQQDAATAKDTAEIIVTAQKRPEKLQDIPVAAAVLSAQIVAQQHVTDLSDINRVVPSVEIKGTFNGRVPYGIRGISTNANEGAIGLTSGVSIQIDGVPVPADSFAANTISDVAQLEVLKGPQATLGGRTASAGVINFVTYAPTDIQKFGISGTLTDDNEYRMDAHASGPITDRLNYAVSGYDSHTPYPVVNQTLGQRSLADSYGMRGKLKWQASDAIDATLMGHYAMSKSTGENFVPAYFTSGAVFFAPPAGLTQSVMFPGYTIGTGNTQYASPVAMGSRYQDIDGSLVVNWHLDGTTITSTTALFRENQWQTQDVFESNNPNWALQFETFLNSLPPFANPLPSALVQPFNNTQTAFGHVNQTTEELKIASDAAKKFSYIAGLFYSDMTVDQSEYRNWTLNPLAKDNISTTQNYSIYARGTAKLTDQFTVVGGLRYNWDNIGWNVNEFFDPAHGIYGDGGFGQGGFGWNLNDKSSALVGDIALQYKPTRDIMGYASYTRGYKPRAFNTVHDFASAQATAGAADLKAANATAQEHIDSFELGLKTSLLDRHMTFNMAAFYTKYNGYQAQLYDNTTGLIATLVLANADASTKGLETDLTYVRGNTHANVSVAYIDAKFTNVPGAVCYPGQTASQGCITTTSGSTQNLTGASLPDSPKFKLSASVQQTVPLEKFNVLLGSNLSYRSSAILQADQNPATQQSSFALLDLSVGIQSKDERTTFTVFVNNLTNHFYYTNMEDFFASATSGNYVIGQPARDSHRYFGGRLAYNF